MPAWTIRRASRLESAVGLGGICVDRASAARRLALTKTARIALTRRSSGRGGWSSRLTALVRGSAACGPAHEPLLETQLPGLPLVVGLLADPQHAAVGLGKETLTRQVPITVDIEVPVDPP